MTILPTRKRDVIDDILDLVLGGQRTPVQATSTPRRLPPVQPSPGPAPVTNWDAPPYPPLLRVPGGGGSQPAPNYPDWAHDTPDASDPMTRDARYVSDNAMTRNPPPVGDAMARRLPPQNTPKTTTTTDLLPFPSDTYDRFKIGGTAAQPPAPPELTGEEPITAGVQPRRVTLPPPDLGNTDSPYRVTESRRPRYEDYIAGITSDPLADEALPGRPGPKPLPTRNQRGEQRERLKAGGIAALIGAILSGGDIRGALAGFSGAAQGTGKAQDEAFERQKEDADRAYQGELADWQSKMTAITDARDRRDKAEARADKRYAVDSNAFDRRYQAQERADAIENATTQRAEDKQADRNAAHHRVIHGQGMARERAQNYLASLASSPDPDDRAYAARFGKKKDGTYNLDSLPSELDAGMDRIAQNFVAMASDPRNSDQRKNELLAQADAIYRQRYGVNLPKTAKGLGTELTPQQKQAQANNERDFKAKQKQQKIDNDRKDIELRNKIANQNSLLSDRNLKALDAETKKGIAGIDRVNKELRNLDKDADDAVKEMRDVQGKAAAIRDDKKLSPEAAEAYRQELLRSYKRAERLYNAAVSAGNALRQRYAPYGTKPGSRTYLTPQGPPTAPSGAGKPSVGRLPMRGVGSGPVQAVGTPPGKPRTAVDAYRGLTGQ